MATVVRLLVRGVTATGGLNSRLAWLSPHPLPVASYFLSTNLFALIAAIESRTIVASLSLEHRGYKTASGIRGPVPPLCWA